MALPGGEDLMDAVAELVRQGHHVTRLTLVVEQEIGMRRRHGGMRKGAGRLAGPRRSIDPGVVEEAPADIGKLAGEIGIGAEHGRPRLVPWNRAVVAVGRRRVAGPVVGPEHGGAWGGGRGGTNGWI